MGRVGGGPRLLPNPRGRGLEWFSGLNWLIESWSMVSMFPSFCGLLITGPTVFILLMAFSLFDPGGMIPLWSISYWVGAGGSTFWMFLRFALGSLSVTLPGEPNAMLSSSVGEWLKWPLFNSLSGMEGFASNPNCAGWKSSSLLELSSW